MRELLRRGADITIASNAGVLPIQRARRTDDWYKPLYRAWKNRGFGDWESEDEPDGYFLVGNTDLWGSNDIPDEYFLVGDLDMWNE